MKKEGRALVNAATKAQNKSETLCKSSHWHFITALMGLTTIIAGQLIHDLWSGIVAALCTMITIWMVYEEVGGLDDE